MTTHGMHSHSGYRSWQGLRQRCENPNDAGFGLYGGRGIRVHPPWGHFPAFWADMGPTWFKGATIERKDNDRGYEPENCIWIAKRNQPQNRRSNVLIETPWGEMTLAEAARQLGMSSAAFGRRYRLGWRGDELFAPPVDKGQRVNPVLTSIFLETPEGRMSLPDAATKFGVSQEALRRRHHRGYAGERLFAPT